MQKQILDATKTTVKGITNARYDRVTVQRIQDKIFLHGLCSDQEQNYLSRYTDHFEQRYQKIA